MSARRRATPRARRITLSGALLALLVAVPAFAATTTVVSTKLTVWQSATTVAGCTSPGTQTASASADAFVDENSPTANHGTDTLLRVRSKNGGDNLRALVRFTLPALPSGCTVTSATLRLHASSADAGRTLQALRVDAAWAEGTVTWSTQPATTGTAATTTSATGYREWTVTSLAASMYSVANNGFLVRDATESAAPAREQRLSSREATSNPPQLVLTFG